MFRIPRSANSKAIGFALTLSISLFCTRLNADTDLEKAIAAIQEIGAKGVGHEAAVEAMKELNRATIDQVPALLAGMDGANELSVNWLRSAIESAIDRGGDFPTDKVQEYFSDVSHSHVGRAFAFELLTRDDEPQKQKMLANLVDDPSPAIRRQAVDALVAKATKLSSAQESIGALGIAISKSRESDQIRSIAGLLGERGIRIDLSRQLGFIKDWHLVGPFEHMDETNFDNPLGPELKLKDVDVAAQYDGKSGTVKWIEHSTSSDVGTVDLNKVIGRVKGAIVYAYAEFESENDQDVSIRLGCINGSKVWINGEPVMSNEVYHNGMDPDQYFAPAKLTAGKNIVLIKVCQNEQTESWAQDWQFQFRFCDPTGEAILPFEKKSEQN